MKLAVYPSSLISLVVAALALVTLARSAEAQCEAWASGFEGGIVDGPVYAQVMDPRSPTPRMIIAGQFNIVAGVPAPGFAAYDGQSWSALDVDALPQRILAVAFHDIGNGPELFAGGDQGLFRWDGQAWIDLGLVSGGVEALISFDDGTGPALFVGGQSLRFPGLFTSRVLLKFTGVWGDVPGAAVAPGPSAVVRALEIHDDGSGPALVLGGSFEVTGAPELEDFARYDGAGLTAVGPAGGLPSAHRQFGVRALHSARRGTERVLHVGTSLPGGITSTPPPGEAAWLVAGPSGWIRLGDAIGISAFTSVPTPGGVDAVWAGSFDSIQRFFGGLDPEIPIDGSILAFVRTMHSFPGVSGDELWVGVQGNSAPDSNLLRLEGTELVSPEPTNGAPERIVAMTSHDFGAGPELAGLTFDGGTQGVLRFDGVAWRELPPPGFFLGGSNLASVNGDLYVSGAFGQALGGFALARFDGAQWQAFGRYFDGFGPQPTVAAVELGSGTEIYVGGRWPTIDDLPGTASLARFDGSVFTSVGGGLDYGFFTASVRAIAGWDDGGGDDLYVAGRIESVAGTPVKNIARFDGSAWSALPGAPELSSPINEEQGAIQHLLPIDLPTGRFLVAAGPFDLVGGAPSSGLAAWTGNSWVNFDGGASSPVRLSRFGSLCAVHDADGSGDRLWINGTFETPGGLRVVLASWDGLEWDIAPGFALQPTGSFGNAIAILSADLGGGRALHVGGLFQRFANVFTQNYARLDNPCGDVVGTPYCTSTVGGSGRVAFVRASGSPSFAANDLTLHLRGAPPGEFALFATGTDRAFAPLAAGVLCVGGQLKRILPPAVTDGSGALSRPFDFGASHAAGVMAGQRLTVQGFFRDVASTGGNVLGSSAALELVVAP